MKNSKKILIALSSIALLVATVFSVISAAVKAGEGTSIEEYTKMKITVSHGFENGTTTSDDGWKLFGSIVNRNASLVGEKSQGGLVTINNTRRAPLSAYGNDTESLKYYIINYDNNDVNPQTLKMRHLYIQPRVGDLDKPETTPSNGFIAEFDIAFLSPTTNVKQQSVDAETKELLWVTDGFNEDGSIKYKLDEDGNKIPILEDVMEPLLIEKRDENGDIVYKTTTNSQGETVFELDENGNKIPEYVEKIDEQTGEIVMVNKVTKEAFKGLSTEFSVEMFNTETKDDGQVSLIKFKTDKATSTVSLNLGENLLPEDQVVNYTFSADEWCHLTIQYDAKSMLTYVYIGTDESRFDTDGDGIEDVQGRLLVAVKNTTGTTVTGEKVPVYPLQFRLGCSSTSGTVAVDNFIGYQGTTIHDPTTIESLPAYETFLYMTDVLGRVTEYEVEKDAEGNVIYETTVDESGETVIVTDANGNPVPVYVLDEDGNKKVKIQGATSVNRYQAFEFLDTDDEMKKVAAGGYYGVDKNGNLIAGSELSSEIRDELSAAINLYNVYLADKSDKVNDGVYDALIVAVKRENAATYLEYAKLAAETSRELSNYEERALRVRMAKEFYNSAGNLIERDPNGDYGIAKELVENVEKTVITDEASYKFVSAMKIFNNSAAYGASITRLKAHYKNAGIYYPNISQDYNDVNTNLTYDSAEALSNAVKDYLAAADVLLGQYQTTNSVKFISTVNLMQRKTSGSWENDGEEVEELWLLALEILTAGEYDPLYQGFNVAKAIFDSANAYFWNQLQQDHVAAIQAKLDSYNDPDTTYIDKAGICTYVDRYVHDNAAYIDMDNEDFKREIARNEAYKVQLNILVGDYEKLLEQNTIKFVNTMKNIRELGTYELLKPLYDEVTVYYYAMNIDYEGVDVYLAEYEALRLSINAIERDSKSYIAIINGLVKDENGKAIYQPLSEITDKDEMYQSLIAAHLCEENLDMTYPGVAAAKSVYDAKYLEYNASAEIVHSEIDDSSTVVYAVRGNWDFDGVVAFVKKLFGVKG